MAAAPVKIPRQAGFKPHKLTGQEIAHSKARKAGRNIHIKDKNGTTKFIASLEGRRLK